MPSTPSRQACCWTIPGDVFVEPDARFSIAQQPRQCGLAFEEREIAQVLAIVLDQVEGIQDRVCAASLRRSSSTSATTVYRTRQQLVEEGLEAVLSRKKASRPSVLPIFDGEKEAKLIALACSEPPKGRSRWTLRMLENKVVELDIVARASDSTIGRVLKKLTQTASQNTMGHPARSK
jgi:hypothetical protein